MNNNKKKVCVYIYLDKEIYYKVSAHMIMEAEQSHRLQSMSWIPR